MCPHKDFAVINQWSVGFVQIRCLPSLHEVVFFRKINLSPFLYKVTPIYGDATAGSEAGGWRRQEQDGAGHFFRLGVAS